MFVERINKGDARMSSHGTCGSDYEKKSTRISKEKQKNKGAWVMMHQKLLQCRISKVQWFIDNENFKYMVKKSESNNKDVDVVSQIYIKQGHRLPLQVSKNKAKTCLAEPL